MKNWDEKLVKHHYFQDFETKQLLQKFSANIFLVTPFNAKIFSKCIFPAKNKVREVEILLFVKVFIFFFIKLFLAKPQKDSWQQTNLLKL